jgi:hypothetical protein
LYDAKSALAAAAQVQREGARPGETIFKGHHSWDLMRQLQLGIMFSIAKSAREAPVQAQPLAEADFAQQVATEPLFTCPAMRVLLPAAKFLSMYLHRLQCCPCSVLWVL